MLSTGETIDGKYPMIRPLGEGGLGAVYEAENIRIVEVLDLGNLPSGDRYMVMPFMDGDTLLPPSLPLGQNPARHTRRQPPPTRPRLPHRPTCCPLAS